MDNNDISHSKCIMQILLLSMWQSQNGQKMQKAYSTEFIWNCLDILLKSVCSLHAHWIYNLLSTKVWLSDTRHVDSSLLGPGSVAESWPKFSSSDTLSTWMINLTECQRDCTPMCLVIIVTRVDNVVRQPSCKEENCPGNLNIRSRWCDRLKAVFVTT